MPSPVGHALAGLAVGVLAAGPRALVRSLDPPAARRPIDTALLAMLPFAALGALPDVDLLFGIHSMYTHSIGAVRPCPAGRARRDRRLAVGHRRQPGLRAHILLDWLGHDTTAPIGIMALWPITPEYFQSDLHLFLPISRRYWVPGFLAHNLTAVAREMLCIGPLAFLAYWRLTHVAASGCDSGLRRRPSAFASASHDADEPGWRRSDTAASTRRAKAGPCRCERRSRGATRSDRSRGPTCDRGGRPRPCGGAADRRGTSGRRDPGAGRRGSPRTRRGR